MKLGVTAKPGELTASPERALHALATIAETEGADKQAWMLQIAKAAGASRVQVPTVREPKFRVHADAVDEALKLYEQTMVLAIAEVRGLLQGASRKADRSRWRTAAKE